MRLRHLLAASVIALPLTACGSDNGTSPTTNRAQLVQQLNNLSTALSARASSTSELDVDALLGAAAAGAAASVVQTGADVTTTGGYNVVAFQTQSSDATSPDGDWIVAWKGESDLVTTFADQEGTLAFTPFSESSPFAYGVIYHAPNQIWLATASTTTLNRTGLGNACTLPASSNFSGTCQLATFTGAISITESIQSTSTTGDTPLTFTLGQTSLDGIVVTEATSTLSRALRAVRLR